jgi:DNA modification methylase
MDNVSTTKLWPADNVAHYPVDRLKAYGKNARVHSKQQIDQIAASITEWGFTMPVLMDEGGTLIAGHARVQAARQLGLINVPAMIATGWTQAQIKAYRLADNKLASNSTWSDEFLKIEFADLKLQEFNLELMGWGGTEIADFLAVKTKGKTDPDAVPDQFEARTKPGDVWVMGDHVLRCGDCLDILPDMDNFLNTIDALITDPPYGIGFKYDQHDDTDYGEEGYGAWIWRVIERAEALCPPGAPVFVWQSPRNVHHFGRWFPRDWRLFIGTRSFSQMTKGTIMHHGYDAVLCWWKPGGEPWTAGETNRDWHYTDTSRDLLKPDNIQRQHPCPRPTAQVAFVVEQWVKPGATILEPFCGSGTTVIAAEMLGRRCVAIEKSPRYCDITLARWEQFTGKEAERG